MSVAANDIAKVILSFSNPEVGDVITNLKLQKLLYYSQGFHLVLFKKQPLFNEKVIAWQYGPVVEEVYHTYKESGSSGITPPDEFDLEMLNRHQKELLKEVYSVYGQFSALKLMNMTHNEPPWTKTKIRHEITHDIMYEYFSTQVR